MENKKIKELIRPQGTNAGGTTVDKAFENYLIKVFTEYQVKQVKEKYLNDWVQLFQDFELKKRNIPSEKNEDVKLKIKPEIKDILKQDEAILKLKGVVKLTGNRIYIAESIIADMIKEVAKRIESTLENIFETLEHNIDLIIIVGGFSNNPIVRQMMKTFARKYNTEVLIPERAEAAVLEGAVVFGWKPEYIYFRKSKKTYGTKISTNFIEGIHPLEKLYIIDGIKRCRGIFSKLVNLNEDLEVGQCKKWSGYACRKDQTSVWLDLYASDKEDVQYCDEEGTYLVGEIELKTPATGKEGDRKVEAKFFFGDTEKY